MQFFKVTNPSLGIFPPLPTIPPGDLFLISNGTMPSLSSWAQGSHGPIDHYAEYEVSSFSGGGGGGAEGGGALPVDLIYFYGQLADLLLCLHGELLQKKTILVLKFSVLGIYGWLSPLGMAIFFLE